MRIETTWVTFHAHHHTKTFHSLLPTTYYIMVHLERSQVHNFAAGPSPLPTAVLVKAAEGLVNYNGTGMGVCELSHRGKEFKAIIEGAEGM